MKYWWWRSVKDLIEQYPAMVQARKDAGPVAGTANYGPQMPHGGAGRVLENEAVKWMCSRDANDVDAVDSAITETARMKNGERRLAIINLVYWKQTHKLYGAAVEVGCSEQLAKQMNAEFIRLVAFYQGRIQRDEVKRKC